MHVLPDPIIILGDYYKDIRPSRARFRARFRARVSKIRVFSFAEATEDRRVRARARQSLLSKVDCFTSFAMTAMEVSFRAKREICP